MRFSLNWLRQWVATDLDAHSVAERLTAAGLEVDELETVGSELDGVVVAEIRQCRPHPDADRLKICEVDFGADEPATIVCGAPNARAGLKAPLATVGSRLPNGMKIKPAKLRGVESRGMLCSSPELGLGDDESGLLELPDAADVGASLARALGLPDHEIEVDLTPNRADCLSIRGLAREFAAIESLDPTPPVIDAVLAESDEAIDIALDDPADCPRYVGRIIQGVDPGAKTPAWMVERLARSGLRSRSPVVDVTNYVLLELGQPMHAFDLDRLTGGIRVRRAREGDEIVLLDGQRVQPEPDMLLICDRDRPIALAGIMGGEDSAVGDETRDILLESAWFNPATIIGKGRRFGLSTDSAHRFERGVDPELQVDAIERATALILEIAGGTPGPVVEEVRAEHVPKRPVIELRLARVNQVLGTDLDQATVRGVLERLGMDLEPGEGRVLVTPPAARRDLELEVDLIEEVARLVGYDELPSRAPGGRLEPIVTSERIAPMVALRSSLHARGFREIMTWSFVSRDDLARLSLERLAQELANPLSQEMAWLRTSLLPGLLRTAATNLRHQQNRLKLFETGHVFLADGNDWQERERLGLLVAGRANAENWLAERREFDFFDLKGEIEQLASCLGHRRHELVAEADSRPWLHPGQAARISLAGEPVGHAGQLHPAVAAELEIEVPLFVAELELEPLRSRSLPVYSGTARFPSVRRDLALLVPEEVAAAEIACVAGEAAGELLEQTVIFDKYRGEGIETGYESLAIGLILRHVSRTLTDEEVDSVIATVVEALQRECNARPRG
ncbi:MAG: phenylalanine--tRNA ligase subunit beta [Candidatus Wenzhouxiangella sp. M2_3B_020]